MYWNQLRRIAYAFSSTVLMAGCSWLTHKTLNQAPQAAERLAENVQTKETKSADYTIRVIAAKLIADSVTVRDQFRCYNPDRVIRALSLLCLHILCQPLSSLRCLVESFVGKPRAARHQHC